jgi:hypothetical protein
MGLINATPFGEYMGAQASWVPWKYHAFGANFSQGNIWSNKDAL